MSAVALCIAGLTFFVLTMRNELRARALADHGVIALADVVAITEDRQTDDGLRVAYRIDVDGNAYEGASRHVARPFLDVARTLGHIEVRYLPEDPSISAPTQAATGRTQFMAFFVSGGLTTGGIALAMIVIATKRKTGRWWV